MHFILKIIMQCILVIIILNGCSKNIESGYAEKQKEQEYSYQDSDEQEYSYTPEPEIAYIFTSTHNFTVNDIPLSLNARQPINTGINNIKFNGVVKISKPSKALIDIEKEEQTAAKFTACISALPLCPITLLLMHAAFNENRLIETSCNGELMFNAYNKTTYFIKTESDEITEPRITLAKFNGIKITEQIMDCDVPEKLDVQ